MKNVASQSTCVGFGRCTGVVGKPPKVHTNGHAATFEEAKAQFEAAWRQWLAWAKLMEAS
jgi:hypothetical protein